MSRYYNDFSDLDNGDELEHHGVQGAFYNARVTVLGSFNPNRVKSVRSKK